METSIKKNTWSNITLEDDEDDVIMAELVVALSRHWVLSQG